MQLSRISVKEVVKKGNEVVKVGIKNKDGNEVGKVGIQKIKNEEEKAEMKKHKWEWNSGGGIVVVKVGMLLCSWE